VFSSLGERVSGARFLDLFAGSGAYGLEALSRGAAGGLFVDNDARALDCLRRNLKAVCKSLRRDESGLSVVQADGLGFFAAGGPPPDLVFVDPPYALIEAAADALFARLGGLLAPRGDPLIVFEMPGGLELAPRGWRAAQRLGKGLRQPTAVLFRRES
jgi:16S rRNA (guanine966-N2)-methyltransferase